MSLPGFSAEASLYRGARHYLGHNEWTGAVSGLVTPSARIGLGDIGDFLECIWDCYVTLGGRFVTCVEVCADIFLPVRLL
jgi:hypothetical protein